MILVNLAASYKLFIIYRAAPVIKRTLNNWKSIFIFVGVPYI